MSTPPTIPTAPAVVETPAARARVTIVAVALAIGATAAAATLLWRPGPDRGDLSYASLAPVRDAAWAATVIDAVGFTVAAFALAIAVCLLAPGRGAVWANLGGVLVAAGGTMFAGGVIAYGVLGWYATAPEALAPEAGTALMEYVADNPARLAAFQFPGLLLFTVGSLLLAGALWRARSVPRWLPVTWVVLSLAQFLTPGRVLDLVQAAGLALFIVIAWYARRTATAAP